VAVASAGPYANNLHLAPDTQPHQHLNTQFLQAGCSTNRLKALKAADFQQVVDISILQQQQQQLIMHQF